MAGCLLLPSAAAHLRAASASRRRGRKGFAVLCASSPARRVPGELPWVDVPAEEAVKVKRHGEYLERVRRRILQVDTPEKAMAIVEALQRLGINYHFEEEVRTILNVLHESFNNSENRTGSLHDVSLSFRLLRQGGFHVLTDAFDTFTDGQGNFKQSLCRDISGLLSLYEASYLGVGEEVLDVAQDFSHKHLKASMSWLEPNVAEQVKDALAHPYHMSLQRFKSRRYLEHFKRTSGSDSVLGELAWLDFNIVQSQHRSELIQFSRWWMNLGLSQDLMFARNQPLKWYTCSMAILSNPKYSAYRFEITKSIALVYIIDDIFDVHGTLDELVLFTEAVKKWDLFQIDTLPDYMKICYTSLYNITNDIACKVYKEHGWDPICSLKKSWIMLFDAFLVEARWFASKHMPMADEYLQNGVISTGVHVILIHIFFLLGHNLTMNNITLIEKIPTLISRPATILRLWDDLGSAKDESQSGFDGSYITCYISEHENCSIESARRHTMDLISNLWKEQNKAVLSSNTFSSTFLTASINMARMVKTMYSYEDNQHLPMFENLVNLLFYKCI